MKVTCSICAREQNGFCMAKGKTKVALNKRRNCSYFILAESKVKNKTPIPTTRVPSWYMKEELTTTS